MDVLILLRDPAAVGNVVKLKKYAQNLGRNWVQGMGQAQRLYGG